MEKFRIHPETLKVKYPARNNSDVNSMDGGNVKFNDKIEKLSYSPFSIGSSSGSSTTLMPEAPDGGYGWVVVAISFMIHFICDGISFSFGIIFPEIQRFFNVSKTMSGVIASLFLSIPLLFGPLAGVLTDQYDCRWMTIVGGIIATSGIILSSFATNIWLFMLTFAISSAIGMSFCYNTAITVVTYYFDEKRALATSLAVTGSGVGAIVLAPVIEYVMKSFGWRMTLLFIAMLLFVLIISGIFIKDLEWPEDTLEYKKRKFDERREKEKIRNCTLSIAGDIITPNEYESINLALQRTAISLPDLTVFDRSYLYSDHPLRIEMVKALTLESSRSKSFGGLLLSNFLTKTVNSDEPNEVYLNNNEEKKLCDQPERAMHNDEFLVANDNAVDFENRDESNICFKSVFEVAPLAKETDSLISKGSENESDRSTDGDNISSRFNLIGESTAHLQTGYAIEVSSINREHHLESCDTRVVNTKNQLNQIWENSKSEPNNAAPANNKIRHFSAYTGGRNRVPAVNVFYPKWFKEPFSAGINYRVPSAPAIFTRKKPKSRHIQFAKIMNSASEWMCTAKTLLAVPAFSVFVISSCIASIFFDIPYVNFPEYSVAYLNITETEASYLLSGIGLTNVFSTVLFGFFGDTEFIQQYIVALYGLFIVLAGICVIAAAFVQFYYQMIVLCCSFGFFISANYALSSVITVNLLCLYDFQTGYGILCLIEGVGNLIGPALVGFVYDNLSNYKGIFVIGGFGIVISGFMLVYIDIYRRFFPEKNDAHEKNIELPEINESSNKRLRFE